MDEVSGRRNSFLIDVGDNMVFCISCGKVCKRLVLPGAARFWCGNHDCGNSEEVIIRDDGSWSVHSVDESWSNDWCSEFSSTVVFAQSAMDQGMKHEDPG